MPENATAIGVLAPLQESARSAAERRRVLANEFGDRSWRQAGEIGDGTGDDSLPFAASQRRDAA